jgi:mono/diheme cytochrome c family protein
MLRNLLLLALGLMTIVGFGACGDAATSDTAPTETPAATSPASSPASTPTQAADAAALFADNCAGCHKADGSGDFGPDLTGEDNVGGVAERIASGGSGMPSFSGDLTDAQIQAIADYVVNEL